MVATAAERHNELVVRQGTRNVDDNVFSENSGVLGVTSKLGAPAVRRFNQQGGFLPSAVVPAVLLGEETDNSVPPVRTVDDATDYLRKLQNRGIRAAKIFVNNTDKNEDLSGAARQDNIGLYAIERIKLELPDLCIISDSCLCGYHPQGKCALLDGCGRVDLGRTLELTRGHVALQVAAGADIIGPASMIPEVVSDIRVFLDNIGKQEVAIMPHLTLRSSLYRTYRNVMSTGLGEQRQAFQIHPSRVDQYCETAREFVDRGADYIMMQPSMFSADLIAKIKEATGVMTGVFSVAGEHKLFVESGASREMHREHALQLSRAGADFIVTYGAEELL